MEIYIITTISLIFSHGGQANGVWIIISRLKFLVRGVPGYSPGLVFMVMISTSITNRDRICQQSDVLYFAKTDFEHKGKIFLLASRQCDLLIF